MQGLQLCKNKGTKKSWGFFWLLWDYLHDYEELWPKSHPFSDIVEQVSHVIARDWQVIHNHVPRDKNVLADLLVSMGRTNLKDNFRTLISHHLLQQWEVSDDGGSQFFCFIFFFCFLFGFPLILLICFVLCNLIWVNVIQFLFFFKKNNCSNLIIEWI